MRMTQLGTSIYCINKRKVEPQTSEKQLQAIQIKEYLIMSNLLFTAVSVDQQETVAGGGDINNSNAIVLEVTGVKNYISLSQLIKNTVKITKISTPSHLLY